MKSSKYGTLPSHKKCHKGMMGEWQYLNRVGKKADEHKKVCITHVC